jgi:hypothetical protein
MSDAEKPPGNSMAMNPYKGIRQSQLSQKAARWRRVVRHFVRYITTLFDWMQDQKTMECESSMTRILLNSRLLIIPHIANSSAIPKADCLLL